MLVRVRNNLISGWRRMTPVAEHGASRRILSKAFLFHQLETAAASASVRFAFKPSLFKFSLTFFSRPASISIAVQLVSEDSLSRMWQVLPPGAAQASRTRIPGASCNNQGTNCDASSCTLNRPDENPGNVVTGTAISR